MLLFQCIYLCVVCCVVHACECAGVYVRVGHRASFSKDLCLVALRHGLSLSLKLGLSARLVGLPVSS